MMSAYERSSLWARSIHILDMRLKLKPRPVGFVRLVAEPVVRADVVTFTSLLGAAEWRWAFEIYDSMPQRGPLSSL